MASSAARRLSVEPPTGVTGAFTGLVLQGTYTLGRRIGYGAVGEVYEAAHVRLPGRVAVKMLRPHLLGNEAAFARFCREAEMMSAVQNPHVVQVLDFNVTPEGLPFFVMEYLDGVDLEVRLAYAGPLPVASVVRLVDAVASALKAAHAHGIVHRDLKPANIFLVREEGPEADFVKVIDFGVSKSVVSGLPSEIDERADQLALAAIAHTMLTGVVHEPHARLAKFVSWDTSAIQAVLDRALAKRPEDRFAEIAEFAQAFSAAAGAAAEGAAAEEPSFDPPPVRTFVEVEETTPTVGLPAAPAIAIPAIEVPELPRGIDRVPRMRQRAIAIVALVLGLAAFLVYKGWRRGAGQVPAVPVAGETTPRAAPEIVPMEPAAANPEAAPPSPQPAVLRSSGRRARALRGEGSRSAERAMDVEAAPPSSASEPEPTPTESPAPKGFSIPEPTPLPPGRDLAPPPAPPE